MDHATFLDLYAGTGAVGLEALSRGAERVVFVESSHDRSKAVKDYLARVGMDDRAAVYQEKAEAYLQREKRAGMTFDIIFADPPYLSDEIERVLTHIGDYNILKDAGCMLVEHSSKKVLPEHLENFRLIKNYKYGDTMLTLYRNVP
jgi:16S rRNA (guanine966-N2)-methyltransferase